jgi:hypothetical protein
MTSWRTFTPSPPVAPKRRPSFIWGQRLLMLGTTLYVASPLKQMFENNYLHPFYTFHRTWLLCGMHWTLYCGRWDYFSLPTIQWTFLSLFTQLSRCIQRLSIFAEEHHALPTLGFTHMQWVCTLPFWRRCPISLDDLSGLLSWQLLAREAAFGFRICSWIYAICRDLEMTCVSVASRVQLALKHLF